MSRQNIFSTEAITLQKFRVGMSKVLSDVTVMDLQVREMQEHFMQGMAYELRAYILADHVENKEAAYTVYKLPWWLKWAERWIKKEQHVLKLDAYHTYPKANVKLPKLGENKVVITKADLNLGEPNE